MCGGADVAAWGVGVRGAPGTHPARFPGNVLASGVREASVKGGTGGPRRPGGCGPHR